MTYQEQNARHRAEIEAFPMEFAFSTAQLEEALAKLGATRAEVCTIGGGGIIRKADGPALDALFTRHAAERDEAYKDDAFLLDALTYELDNHEYGYTGDPEPALLALGLTVDDERKAAILTQAKAAAYRE